MFRRVILGVSMVLVSTNLAAAEGGLSVSIAADAEGNSASETATETTAVDVPVVDSPQATPAPENIEMPASFDGKLEYGHSLYLKESFDAALSAYEAAKEMKSNDPLVLYFIACAQTKLGKYDEAVQSLQAMKTLSGEKLASLTARALFLTAVVEEMRKDDEKAVAAWTEYKTFITGHPQTPGFMGSADSRLEVLRKKQEQYEAYDIVRQRISTSQ